jgi:hypothetical protein
MIWIYKINAIFLQIFSTLDTFRSADNANIGATGVI